MDDQLINEVNSYLSFKLGNETFAAHVNNVINILELTNITPVPRSPEYMKGVINLRGTVLPIIDTRLKFGMSETVFTIKTCILVLNVNIDGENVLIGGLVDSVLEVFEIEVKDLLPIPSIGKKYKTEFIKGLIRLNEEFVIILDIDKMLSIDDATLIIESSHVENRDDLNEKKENKKSTKKTNKEFEDLKQLKLLIPK